MEIDHCGSFLVQLHFTMRPVFGAYQLGLREGVELPIVKEVLAVIEGKKAPKEIAPLLMQRQAQEELNYLLENSLTF